jgi:hypothetical protein
MNAAGSYEWLLARIRELSTPGPVSEEWLLEQIRTELRPRRRLADATIVEVRGAPGRAVLLFHWRQDPRLYGLPLDLGDTHHEYLYGTPVHSAGQWLEEFFTSLTVHLDTGAVGNSARVAREDYIVLDDSRPWPWDDRFSLDVFARQDSRRPFWEVAATPDRSGGDERVATATVSRATVEAAELERLVYRDGAPPSVVLDVARLAVHEAGESGALRVVTTLSHPDLALLGFQLDATGARVVDTAFLDEDRQAAAALLSRSRGESAS